MKTRAKPLRFRGSFGAILLLPLGLGMLLLGIAAPIMLARTPDGDPWLAFALLSLPCLAVGMIALLNGIAAAATRIEMDADGVSIRAPAWRGAPFPPVRTFRASWSEVTAVRRRVESYSLLGLPFPVVVHQVRAGERCIVLGGRSVFGLARAMEEIAGRAGLALVECPAVDAGMWASLRKGPPAWPG